jgi:hypothetical protein
VHGFDDAVVVGLDHETCEGAECANGNELQVRDGHGAEEDLFHGSGALQSSFTDTAAQDAVHKSASVRRNGVDVFRHG